MCTSAARADFHRFEFESRTFALFHLQSVDMNGWRLESPDQKDVVSVLNTASNTVVADIQELSPTVQTLHWVAPPSYLGNRVRDEREQEITPALVTATVQVSYVKTLRATNVPAEAFFFVLRFHLTAVSSPTSPNHLEFPARA